MNVNLGKTVKGGMESTLKGLCSGSGFVKGDGERATLKV